MSTKNKTSKTPAAAVAKPPEPPAPPLSPAELAEELMNRADRAFDQRTRNELHDAEKALAVARAKIDRAGEKKLRILRARTVAEAEAILAENAADENLKKLCAKLKGIKALQEIGGSDEEIVAACQQWPCYRPPMRLVPSGVRGYGPGAKSLEVWIDPDKEAESHAGHLRGQAVVDAIRRVMGIAKPPPAAKGAAAGKPKPPARPAPKAGLPKKKSPTKKPAPTAAAKAQTARAAQKKAGDAARAYLAKIKAENAAATIGAVDAGGAVVKIGDRVRKPNGIEGVVTATTKANVGEVFVEWDRQTGERKASKGWAAAVELRRVEDPPTGEGFGEMMAGLAKPSAPAPAAAGKKKTTFGAWCANFVQAGGPDPRKAEVGGTLESYALDAFEGGVKPSAAAKEWMVKHWSGEAADAVAAVEEKAAAAPEKIKVGDRIAWAGHPKLQDVGGLGRVEENDNGYHLVRWDDEAEFWCQSHELTVVAEEKEPPAADADDPADGSAEISPEHRALMADAAVHKVGHYLDVTVQRVSLVLAPECRCTAAVLLAKSSVDGLWRAGWTSSHADAGTITHTPASVFLPGLDSREYAVRATTNSLANYFHQAAERQKEPKVRAELEQAGRGCTALARSMTVPKGPSDAELDAKIKRKKDDVDAAIKERHAASAKATPSMFAETSNP